MIILEKMGEINKGYYNSGRNTQGRWYSGEFGKNKQGGDNSGYYGRNKQGEMIILGKIHKGDCILKTMGEINKGDVYFSHIL